MTQLRPFHTAFLGSVTLLASLLGSPSVRGQGPKADPKTVLNQPFAALDNYLLDMKNTSTQLSATANQLKADRKRLEQDRKSYQAAQNALDRDLAAFTARKAQVLGTRRKWLCNLSGTLHNDPSECDQPDLGGVWVNVDANGQPAGRWTPPTAAQLDALRKEEARLGLQKDLMAVRKDKLDREEQSFKAENDRYNKLGATLTKDIDYLSKPTKVLQDARDAYIDAVARSGGKADPTVMRAFDKMATEMGKPIGSGQCVALVRDFTNLGPAKDTWKPGDSVKSGALVPFAPAATFVDGKYPDKATGNHAVIVLDKSDKGLMVLDQYTGKPAGIRLIPDLGGRDSPVNKAKIEAGEAKAKTWGLSPDDADGGKAYWNAVYNYKNPQTGKNEPGSYNPSNDAANYSYVKQ